MNYQYVCGIDIFITNYTAADKYQQLKSLDHIISLTKDLLLNSAPVNCISTFYIPVECKHSRTVHMCILAADFNNLHREDAQYSSHNIMRD